MSDKDVDYDELLKKAVQDDYENTIASPTSKEVTWHQIQKQLKDQKSSNKSVSPIWKKVIAAVVIFSIISISFLSGQNTAAFGWFTKMMTETQGTITQIIGSSGSGSGVDPGAPGDNMVNENADDLVTDIDFTIEDMSLGEAKEVANFNILLPDPELIPNELILKNVTVELMKGEYSDYITLNYVNGDDYLEISQMNFEEHSFSIGVDANNTEVLEMDIHGSEATLLIFKDNTKRLVWSFQNSYFEIHSNIPEDSIIEIAESLN